MASLDELVSKSYAGTFQLRQFLAEHCTPDALDRVMAMAEVVFKDMVVDQGSIFTPIFSFHPSGSASMYLCIDRGRPADEVSRYHVKLRVVPKMDGYSDGLELFDDGKVSEYENWIAFRAGLMEQGLRRFFDNLPPHSQKTLHEFIRFTSQTADIYDTPTYQVKASRNSLTISILNHRKPVCQFTIGL